MQVFSVSIFLFTHDFDFGRTYCVYAMSDTEGKKKQAQVLLKFYLTRQSISFFKNKVQIQPRVGPLCNQHK